MIHHQRMSTSSRNPGVIPTMRCKLRENIHPLFATIILTEVLFGTYRTLGGWLNLHLMWALNIIFDFLMSLVAYTDPLF